VVERVHWRRRRRVVVVGEFIASAALRFTIHLGLPVAAAMCGEGSAELLN
jgi:hypothetical protein